MSSIAIKEAMRKLLAKSDGSRDGAPLTGTSRVGVGTKRQLSARLPTEDMSRSENAPVDELTVTPPNGIISSDPKGPAPSSTTRPFTIILSASESDSGLNSGPAGLELASRAIFPGDRAFLCSQTPEAAAFAATHAALKSMNHTVVLAEKFRYYAEEAEKNRARSDKYKEDYRRAQSRESEVIRELKAKEKDLEELDQVRSKATKLEGEITKVKAALAAASEEKIKLVNMSRIMLLKGWDACLKQLVESNPRGFNIASLDIGLISDSYLDTNYEEYVPPPFVGDQFSIKDKTSTFPEGSNIGVGGEVAP